MSQSQPQKITFTTVEKSKYGSTFKTNSRNTYNTAMREADEEISPDLKKKIQSGPIYFGQYGTGSKTGMYFTLVNGFSRKQFKANSETVDFQWFLIDQNWYKQAPDRQQLLMIDSKQSKNYLACPIKHIADWVCKFIGNHKNDILEFMKNPDQQKYNYKGEGTNHGGAANLILNNYTSGDRTITPCIGLVLENSSHRHYADKFNFCAGKYEEKDGYWTESQINSNKPKKDHKQPGSLPRQYTTGNLDHLFTKKPSNSKTPKKSHYCSQLGPPSNMPPINNSQLYQMIQQLPLYQQAQLLANMPSSNQPPQHGKIYNIGDHVYALWNSVIWYPAIVIRVNANGYYTLQYPHDGSIAMTYQDKIQMETETRYHGV